ncbi:MAG TPA: ArsI/CadI family heavy metal resistance metalloenzyme [Chloroflexota bacterium]|nr:ArsI/CadI family heavy metal resistance metalloenzyme [Chloroflexota bacterium]
MSRIQLALNVSDLDSAVDFYSKLFNSQPAKRYPGYANFAIVEPPLKLVLIENPGASDRLNHLGVEVFSAGEVAQEHDRLTQQGLQGRSEEGVTCCYAVQDKFWVDDPDKAPWEIYTVLADADVMACGTRQADGGQDPCCAGNAVSCSA